MGEGAYQAWGDGVLLLLPPAAFFWVEDRHCFGHLFSFFSSSIDLSLTSDPRCSSGVLLVFDNGKPWGQPTKARDNPSRLRPKKTREVALEREK